MSYQSYYKQHALNTLQQQQDQHIQQITQIAQHLKHKSKDMNRQLQRQRAIAQQLDHQLDLTNSKLNGIQRKLGTLLQTDDAGQICTCVMMAGLTLIFLLCLILV